jgi:aryl-alcohol dehydrogenase-like predicted oxidoreductase
MEYVHLGRLGLLVSPLCLETMNFGWDVPGTDDDEA